MGILSGLVPWIVFWILVGNVPLAAAVLVALVVAVLALIVSRVRGVAVGSLEIGAIGTFSVLAILTFTLSQPFMERWILALSSAGILLVALVGVLIGKSFVREFAEADQPAEVVKSDLFGPVTASVAWIWVAAFAVMTVSSAIPPIAARDATPLATTPLSAICYWVIPVIALALAVLAGGVLTDRMVAAALSPDVVRKTTFVAFRELAIDELLYLAKEKADREVGAGMEAYAVQVGGLGTPLTGDESRESWPATYKVRERR